MFKNETKQAARGRAIKGLAAAASLAVMAVASHASAETFTLVSASMNQNYFANIAGFGEAIDGPVTFQVAGYANPPTTSLFGFCIDIYHEMYLGNLGYAYTSNQDTGGGLVANSGTTLNSTQITEITNLVDTGMKLHDLSPNDPTTILQLAAIQAAIWTIEVPFTDGSPTVSLVNPNATATVGGTSFQQYYNDYLVPGNYTNLAGPNAKVFTISDGAHQSFAIGLPGGVPEPATWAMMLTGFFGMGSVLRSRRKLATAAI